jgi:transcriptional regulator with XRE-family HTH domain
MNEKRIMENIKRLRLDQRMSLEQLAMRTGLTRGYLSKIENSHKAPPFSTLLKVANGLGVDMAFLLFEDRTTEAPEGAKLSIVRANEEKGVDRKDNAHDYHYEPLAYRMREKSMEPFIVLAPLDRKDPVAHEGEEFIYVLQGAWEFIYGDKTYLFGPGDSIYFDSSVPHCGKSIGKERAKVLAVLYSVKRS